MSLARLYTVKKSRKEWTCGKCGDKIAKGESVIHFSVGFRGYERHRCSKQSCYPKPSERESSLISQVYAAQEDADFSAGSIEDLRAALESVADACEEVAREYEYNEMYEVNYDLQERVSTLEAAAEELRNWDYDDEEPTEENREEWEEEYDNLEEAYSAWISDAQDQAEQVVNGVELP